MNFLKHKAYHVFLPKCLFLGPYCSHSKPKLNLQVPPDLLLPPLTLKPMLQPMLNLYLTSTCLQFIWPCLSLETTPSRKPSKTLPLNL